MNRHRMAPLDDVNFKHQFAARIPEPFELGLAVPISLADDLLVIGGHGSACQPVPVLLEVDQRIAFACLMVGLVEAAVALMPFGSVPGAEDERRLGLGPVVALALRLGRVGPHAKYGHPREAK